MALSVSRAARAGALLALAATALARPVRAQTDADPGHPWYVGVSKWAKWPTLAAAIGLTAAAIMRKDDADQVYGQLQSLCREDSDACRPGSNGAYTNADAEALYQETLRLDAQARRWMIGGQGFLFVSGGLFLIDLVAGKSKPKDIPFTPFKAWAAPGALGLRWEF